MPATAAMSEPPEPGATLRRELLAILEIAKDEVVALVDVALVMRASLKVEEAFERKPPINCITVDVACSFPACLVNGKANVRAAGKEVRQSPLRQRMVVEAY